MRIASSQAGHDDRLATDFVGQPAEQDEARRTERERDGDHDVDRHGVDLQHVLQEEQRVELAGVPHHRLAGGQAEQSEKRDPGVLPLAEGFDSGALEPLPSSFMRRKVGDLFSDRRIQTEMPSRMKDSRNGMRQPQAANSSLLMMFWTIRITTSDRKRPSVAVVWIQDV